MAVTSPENGIKAADARDSDNASFRSDLVSMIPHMRAFARTLCRNSDLADDLAQEALAKAWQARASFQAGTNLKAWLFMILRNAYYSLQRRRWRQADWTDATEELLEHEGAQQASAELSDLRRALAALPDEQREALILVGAGGFDYEEAASICGCAVGTIKSRVSRGRTKLVKLMDGDGLSARRSAEAAYQGIEQELDTLLRRQRVRAHIPIETTGNVVAL